MSGHIELVKKTIKYHGVPSALYQIGLKAVNKVLPFKILTCVLVTEMKPSSKEKNKDNSDQTENPSKFQQLFLDEEQLKSFSVERENELPMNFLMSAIQKGDECLGIIDDGALAGYGWYSNCATITDVHDLHFCFDPSYMYAYKGFTKYEYRGQRLQGMRLRSALDHYHQKGFDGIVYYIESDNFDSLKSCYRLGFKKVGSIAVLKAFGKVFHYHSRSCLKHNIRLQ